MGHHQIIKKKGFSLPYFVFLIDHMFFHQVKGLSAMAAGKLEGAEGSQGLALQEGQGGYGPLIVFLKCISFHLFIGLAAERGCHFATTKCRTKY